MRPVLLILLYSRIEGAGISQHRRLSEIASRRTQFQVARLVDKVDCDVKNQHIVWQATATQSVRWRSRCNTRGLAVPQKRKRSLADRRSGDLEKGNPKHVRAFLGHRPNIISSQHSHGLCLKVSSVVYDVMLRERPSRGNALLTVANMQRT